VLVAATAALAVVSMVAMNSSTERSALLSGSMPMSTIMKDIRGNPNGQLSDSGLKTRMGSAHGDAVISTLRQLDQPSVQDTTGRTLSDEAIKASGLSDQGKLSDSDLAVLETAGSLTPQLAAHRTRGQLPSYIQVAQNAAARDENDSEYMDAIPGNIVTVKAPNAVDPKVAARKAKHELDRLNKGYAKSMQKWLTGSDTVGDVTQAIDTRSASFLANTGDMGRGIPAETEKVILDTADKQHFHEKNGLVKSEADKGEIPQEVLNAEKRLRQSGESFQNLNHLLRAEKAVPGDGQDPSAEGVVHTEDGFVLRIDPRAAGKSSPMRPMAGKAQLAMLADAPEVEVDPREATIDGCLCTGSSDEDKGPKCSCIGDPSFPKVDEVFSPSEITRWNGNEVHQQSGAMKGIKVQSLLAQKQAMGGRNAVEATADGINSYLMDLSLRAEQHKGTVDASKLANFRATVQSLQDIVLRDPQSRDLVARRLSLLKSSVAKSQKLQDYDSVYLAPYVDDLDNYLQGVLTEVNRVEIPSLDDDEEKAVNVNGAQILRATAAQAHFAASGTAVLPDKHVIKHTLAALVTAAEKLGKVGKGKMMHLKETVAAVNMIAEKVPESRDLLAERLTQYKARQAIKSNKAGTTSLQDYDSVYLAPYVDDLDNYLQGVLNEVNRVEIPSLDEDEEKAVNQGAQTLKGRFTKLMPLDPTKHRRDLNMARRHGGYDEATGTIDMPVQAVPELGEFRDKMEWQQHPFDRSHAEEKQFWKSSEDSFSPQDATMVFGAGRLRRESKTQAVHNPYGWLGAKGAEVPVTSADSEDTRTGGMFGGYHTGAGVSTRTSLEAGSKLCQLVNCNNRGAIPFPPAARGQQGLRQALAEASATNATKATKAPERERPFLGDEIFDMGVDNGYNNNDVIMPADSPNISPSYYMAKKQQRPALAHWERANALLHSAEQTGM